VWALRDETTSFQYSDGDAEEANLRSILTTATNLSSLSLELEGKYNNWSSEYHVSPVRANLLRYMDLTHKTTALELGCGCGALTRYLGEQGLTVDAVDGSQRRANLAQIRCHDLPNVNLISSNFFDLSLPENYYDAIFFVGVMEYAGRFSPTDLTAEKAVIRLLNSVQPSLTGQGIIVIAIENRLGRKYLCGAGEDHYGTAFEGIHGYPNYSGIKTWSQSEWRTLLQDAKLAYKFHYPFPDYKLPSLVLNGRYVAQNSSAWTHLTGIPSRDYHGLMSPQDDLVFWQSAQQAGCLGTFSNSFLIVAGPDKKQVDRLTPFDFVQTSTLTRQPQFRTQTRRRRSNNLVEKVYLQDFNSTDISPIRHVLDTKVWQQGIPLSNLWLQRLRIHPNHELFVQLSTEYFDYLTSCFNKAIDPGALVDVLPMNIMVATSGSWQSFDHEWITTLPISAPFIFFRGLFYFSQVAQEILQVVYRDKPTWTLQTGLDCCFSAAGLTLGSNLDKFIAWEETIQNTAVKNRKGVTTRDFLRLRLSGPRQTVQLFWAPSIQTFAEDDSQTNYISIGNVLQSFSFVLPKGIYPPIWLRLDPGVDKGIFRIEHIYVRWVGAQADINLQTYYLSNSNDSNALSFQNISFKHIQHSGRLFYAHTNDPYMYWLLPTDLACHRDGCIHIEVAMNWFDKNLDTAEDKLVYYNPPDFDSPKRQISF
jgi:SAM-dependent methyltransferase